ncbi:MAG: glycosyltransferase family 2 protein [Mariprofundus sp.]
MASLPVKPVFPPLSQPLLTVALPVYNGATTLVLAIRSILMQSFTDWELIILDDASTDNSLAVMRSFDDQRIRLVEGEKNMGLSARLNMAVAMARGVYFARMDQDDISYPDRFEKQLDYLKAHPDIDLLAASTISFRGDGEALGRLPVATSHEKICARPWNGFHMPHPTWMGKTNWFRCHRYVSFADGAEDQHLLLRTYRMSRFACLDEPLLAYREGERPLKKMLRARRIFMRVYMRYLASKRHYATMVMMLPVIFMKMIADILHAVGITEARNRLHALTVEECLDWQTSWHRIRKTTGAEERDTAQEQEQ